MKKILLSILFGSIASLGAMAQTADSVHHVIPKVINVAGSDSIENVLSEKLIPISREQAEILVAKMVEGYYTEQLKEHRADSLLLSLKVETLKRKLLDDALRKLYTQNYETRLDRLEKLICLSLMKQGTLTPEMMHWIFPERNTPANMVDLQEPLQQEPAQAVPQTASQLRTIIKDSVEVAPQDININTLVPEVKEGPGRVQEKLKIMTDTVYLKKTGIQPFLKHVFFAFNSSALSDKDMKQLDEVIVIMKKNPTMRIKVEGFSSPVGNLSYNNKLSKLRAESCINYLQNKGIDSSRMIIEMGGIDSVSQPSADARRVDISPYYGI